MSNTRIILAEMKLAKAYADWHQKALANTATAEYPEFTELRTALEKAVKETGGSSAYVKPVPVLRPVVAEPVELLKYIVERYGESWTDYVTFSPRVVLLDKAAPGVTLVASTRYFVEPYPEWVDFNLEGAQRRYEEAETREIKEQENDG